MDYLFIAYYLDHTDWCKDIKKEGHTTLVLYQLQFGQ